MPQGELVAPCLPKLHPRFQGKESPALPGGSLTCSIRGSLTVVAPS